MVQEYGSRNLLSCLVQALQIIVWCYIVLWVGILLLQDKIKTLSNTYFIFFMKFSFLTGRASQVGKWTRVEGTPCDPNPNKPFAKMDNPPLFNLDGRLNPSITILGTTCFSPSVMCLCKYIFLNTLFPYHAGCSVTVPSEVILLNSIVLPYKELTRSFKNEIIL